ncbi:helix-turn-helix domain-containing protein [Trinickia diaoshuihuensis]|uniref:helix-turn-helix domain-containing protein n=1 Tax=Trinickia diaoshuihuensis TaxID=2292265 RepID=UPI000E221A15|nr:helix-turn-helix transcriptional regulator [Trinickia diaoshuihuensis]
MDKDAEIALAEAVGRSVRARREQAGYTQEQVAEALGLQREAVAPVERGTAIPTVVRLVELAELFGCNIDALLLESSIRADDQARAMAKILDGLFLKDRQMLVRGLQELASRFREK